MSVIAQINQPYVKEDIIIKSDEEDTNHIDESGELSRIYSPMSVDHNKSLQDACRSLTAYRLRCDVDVYTSELYSYLLDVEVINNI